MLRTRKGFTLIEVAIAAAIMAVLTASVARVVTSYASGASGDIASSAGSSGSVADTADVALQALGNETLPARGGEVTIIRVDGVRYAVHTFQDVGEHVFEVLDGPLEVEYLIVGGGGGGGRGYVGSGGGGGGGLLQGTTPLAGVNAVTVGAGGLRGTMHGADAIEF